MHTMRRLALGLAIAASTQLAIAGNEVRVFSQPNCTEWLKLTSNGKKKCLLGFLSGMNHGYAINHKGHDPLEKVTSDKEVFVWMDTYCNANPGLDISDGGVALFKELKAK